APAPAPATDPAMDTTADSTADSTVAPATGDPAAGPAPGAAPTPAPRPPGPSAAAAEAPPAPLHAAPAPRWLRVRVGAASYALELLRVQEVVRLMPIVAMRGAGPAVLGVMSLRGRSVPVFDLGLWLGTGRVEPGDQGRIVVVERDDE